MPNRLNWIEEELAQLKEAGLYNRIRTISSPQGATLVVDGKQVLNFCSNNYLGLANHPRLVKAGQEALAKFGAGPAAVRTIAGTLSLHLELEQRLAEFKGVPAAILFQSGFCANGATLPALVGKEDAIISDELNHASIIDGSRLSGAAILRYAHCDPADLEKVIVENKGKYRRLLVVTDGVFSMDGDIAPLDKILAVTEKHDVILMVDDAHGEGVLGRGGRGIVDHFGLHGKVDIEVGTLSKAFGVVGGVVAGKPEIVEWLRQRGRPFLFSSAVTPADAGACLEAVKILEESTELVEKLWANAEYFKKEMRALGFDLGLSTTPITPVMLGEAPLAQQFSRSLFEQGVFAMALGFPTVPRGRARIRVMISAAHSRADLDRGLEAFSQVGKVAGGDLLSVVPPNPSTGEQVTSPEAPRGLPRVIRALVLLLFVSLFFGLLLLFFLGTFSRLMADDFCYFANAREMGAWNGLVNIYTTWSGRFSAIALSMLLEPLNRTLAQAAPGVILLAWLLSLIGLLVLVIQKFVGVFPRSLAWVSAAAVLFLTCLVAPNRFQVLYWLNGSITYTVPLVALTALLYWCLRMTWQQKEPSPLLLGLFSLAVLVSGGFSETTATLQLSVFFLLFILFAVLKAPRRALVISGLGVGFSLAAMLIFLVIPRQSHPPGALPAAPGDLHPGLVIPALRVGLHLPYGARLSAAVSFRRACRRHDGQPAGSQPGSGITSPNFPAGKSSGSPPASPRWPRCCWSLAPVRPPSMPNPPTPSRAPFSQPPISWYSVSSQRFSWPGSPPACRQPEKPGSGSDPMILSSSLGLSWPASTLCGLAARSTGISCRHARFRTAWDERDRVVQTYRVSGKPLLELKAINSQHGISELETDPDFWVNKCFARYYGLEKVTAK